VSACASSSHSIIDSYNYIRLGKAEVFICGGSEASIHPAGVGGFNALKALSTNNKNFMQASRPFDRDRDGFVLGEGAGALVLENYEHAVSRGAKIYAEIIGGGMSADAHHITAPHPEGEGAVNVMKQALKDAKIVPEKIDYINVHGTSTPLGDVSEMKAIHKVFNNHIYKLNVSSTKSMTGHLLGAAGAIESIASILAIEKNLVPPTINLDNLEPVLDKKVNYTANQAQSKSIKYSLCNTFGFGGHNASIIFKEI
jgi:3-oxoacyl-[acyl-carrier-protein] synthase II